MRLEQVDALGSVCPDGIVGIRTSARALRTGGGTLSPTTSWPSDSIVHFSACSRSARVMWRELFLKNVFERGAGGVAKGRVGQGVSDFSCLMQVSVWCYRVGLQTRHAPLTRIRSFDPFS